MLIFTYADWCGHCKTFKPIWNQFKQKYGKVIDMREVNADKDASIIENLNVSGFPTVILLNGKRIEMDGPRTMEGLESFVLKNLNPHVNDDLKKYRSK